MYRRAFRGFQQAGLRKGIFRVLGKFVVFLVLLFPVLDPKNQGNM